jgi:tetratricopeptide (TPR) repeat protein
LLADGPGKGPEEVGADALLDIPAARGADSALELGAGSAVAEEPVSAAEVTEERPVPPTRDGRDGGPRRRSGAGMLVGALAGLLLGVVGTGAAWYFLGSRGEQGRTVIQKTTARSPEDAQAAKEVKAVHDVLAGAGAIPRDKKEVDLSAAVGQLVTGKKQAEEGKEKAEEGQQKTEEKLKVALKERDEARARAMSGGDVAVVRKERDEARKALDEVAAAVGAKGADVLKKVADLRARQKGLEARLGEVNAALAKAAGKEGPEGVAELAKSREGLQGELAKVRAEQKGLRAEQKRLHGALVAALKELGATPESKTDLAKELIRTIIAVREKAKAPLVGALEQAVGSLGGLGEGAGRWMQAALDRAAVEGQLRYYQAREPLIQGPEQKLDTWIALFQHRSHKGGKDERLARQDARWVLAHAKSDEAKAKAHYLQGLIARNEGKYVEAVKDLQEATKHAPKGGWGDSAAQDLARLTNPTKYYLPEAERLQSEGRLQEALALLDTGLGVFPGNGRMLARRGLVRLDLATTPAKLRAAEKQIRADAEAARKRTKSAAAGYYALGRLEEDLGHLPQAEQHYRQALKRGGANPAEVNRYRIALARILQRELEPSAAGPAEGGAAGGAAGEEESEAPPERTEARARPALRALVLLAVVGVQEPPAGAGDEDNPRLKESIELAKELIKSDDPKTKGQGWMLLGKAHTQQGKRTQGLQEYLKGLRLAYPGKAPAELRDLVTSHPAFQQPDVRSQPSAFLAEKHYGLGLARYWDGKYPQAEEEFKKAVAFYGDDARYRYFLGLARLAQRTRRKREAAAFDFEQAARLEAENRPGTAVVNASLERIQGRLRQYLDRFRDKAQAAPR